jgi:hypothetical protein
MMGTTDDSADHIAIGALVHRYAFHVRRGEGVKCGDLFTADAIYDIGQVDARSAGNTPVRNTRIEGRDAIGRYIAGSGSHGIRICPLIHNLLIDVNGDTATATSILESRTWPTGREFIGEYEDNFRREDGRWLFSRRCFMMFMPGAVQTDG